ncbi:MAG TPA: cache domain-containing protein, partial [Deferrisomatales bacterium]|nr:cache domain-containing protein [Deferrisomatales bacterium]
MKVWRPRSSRSVLILTGGVLATVLVLGGLVSATHALRAEARDKYFEQYNRQQLLLAQEAARKIEEQFDSFYRSLTLAVRLLEGHELSLSGKDAIRDEMRKVLDSMTGSPLVEYSVMDKNGMSVGLAPEDPYTLGRDYSWREYYQWARDEAGPADRYLSPFMEMAGGLLRGDKALIAAKGLYREDGGFRGVIIGLINFDEIARRHVLSVRIGEHGYAWLVDSKNGSILVDPRGSVSGQSFDSDALSRWPRLRGLLKGTQRGEPGMDWYDFEDPAVPGET